MCRIFLLLMLGLPVCVGCNKSPQKGVSTFGAQESRDKAQDGQATEQSVKAAVVEKAAPNALEQPAKGLENQEKPRKIRYAADMKLVVEKLDDAEEALDAARKEAKGEYEKVEVNRSANVVRSGTWRVRVPVNNLNSFRKAVAKIGNVERDTIESEDMTAKYYDLETHIKNRKAEQT